MLTEMDMIGCLHTSVVRAPTLAQPLDVTSPWVLCPVLGITMQEMQKLCPGEKSHERHSPLFYTLVSLFLLYLVLFHCCSQQLLLFQSMIFSFCVSSSSSHPSTGAGKGEQGDSEQCVIWSVSVGILHWGVPLLNHDKLWENIQSRAMKMMKNLERKLYEEQLKSLGFSWRRGWGDCRKGSSELSTASWQRRECTHQKLEFFGTSPAAGLLQPTSEAGQFHC